MNFYFSLVLLISAASQVSPRPDPSNFKALGGHLHTNFVPFGKASWTVNQMQINFVHCVMNATKPDEAGAQCPKKLGYVYRGIEECAVGKEGQWLHSKHGTRTNEFKPPTTYIPTFAFYDKYAKEGQDMAEKDFKRVVCSKFPPGQKAPGSGT